MKLTVIWMTGILLLFCSGPAFADAPGLLTGVKVKNGNADLKLSSNTNPTIVDWNNDGSKDLLVGEFTQGYITLLLNRGTNLKPVYDGGNKVQSNGSPITTTYG